jgi:FAD:protein FMN transferase
VITLKLSRRAMACEFEAILCGEGRSYLEQVAALALDEVERLDAKFNCFDSTSEVSYVNAEAAGRSVIASPDLFGILQLAGEVWSDTSGAFDITAGPLIEIWREAERAGTIPGREAIQEALGRVGMSHVVLDESSNSVRFDREGVRINLGAIGKGYAVRRAASILNEYGIESALISAGKSTVCALGDRPGGCGWRIGIRHPRNVSERVTTVDLRNQALSTSGGVRQVDEAAEEIFEHIIDPLNGAPADSRLISASVITEDPALADALSTAFYLRGKEFAVDFCRSREGVEAVLVEAESGADDFSVGRF